MLLNDTFLLGCAYLKEANYPEALLYFRRLLAAYEEDSSSVVPPELLSYFGLALALGENRIKEAVTYCTAAIKKEFYRSEFYINLSRVYLSANRRSSAVDVLYKGLKIDNQDQEQSDPQSRVVMTDQLVDLLAEEFTLKRLRRIVDQTAADLRWRTASDMEAHKRIVEAREHVLELFPDGGDLFDRIYRSRFERIFKERLEHAINFN
ncbi:MAG: hypothetical protein HY203_00895 [Nitrospirae bacterium]|nr:hypothetical protein [Nitrospirota bacterium]